MAKASLLKKIADIFLNFFSRETARGLLLYLRKSQSPKKVIEALISTSQKLPLFVPLKKEDKIVVVGLGIGGVTLAQHLHQAGFSNVTLVGNRSDVGGKCVQLGCMPFEYFYENHMPFKDHNTWIEGYGEFVSTLQSMLCDSLVSLGYSWIESTALRIQDKNLYLENEVQVSFDHCILAVGSSLEKISKESSVTLKQFWTENFKEINIVTDNNPAALSLADCACVRGIKANVFFKNKPLFFSTPSFKEFKKSAEKKGISISTGLPSQKIPTLYLLPGTLNAIEIDQRKPRETDVDMISGTYFPRQDISFLGDASGLMAASEAELHAMHLCERLKSGTRLSDVHSSRYLENLPTRLHASTSLAWVGPLTDFLRHDWRSLDFARIGWSLANQKGGKLWYCLNDAKTHISSIHIFHPDAGTLISMAATLKEKAIDDLAWQTFTVHPCSFEIFKTLAQDAIKYTNVVLNPVSLNKNSLKEFHIPHPLNDGDHKIFADLFTQEERVLGKLSHDPTLYFLQLFALKKALNLSQNEEFIKSSKGTLRIEINEQHQATLYVRHHKIPFEVEYLESNCSLKMRIINQELRVKVSQNL